jgi:hypothetical protein
MTRFLSESLNAPEPSFRLQLRELEAANGAPNADIRLSADVAQATRSKLLELGLDPKDTTPKELYQSLANKMAADDVRLTRLLQTRAATHISAEADVIGGLVHLLKEAEKKETSFALKPVKFKALIKKLPPRKAMKQLGYRSVDSLLRHEASALILTAARLTENASWLQQFLSAYKRLTAQDFETRPLSIIHAEGKRWTELAQTAATHHKNTVFDFRELGAVVLLPLPSNAPVGSVMASLMLAVQAIGEIASSSNYLQVCQVRPDFGAQVLTVVDGEPKLPSHLFNQPVPWQLIQRSLSRLSSSLHEDLFEPHLPFSDMNWRSLGHALHDIEPSLAFWNGCEHLGIVHESRAVSMHVLDVALNLCNQVSFEDRIVHYFQQSLWHELLLRYLQPKALEATLLTALQPQLQPAPAYAYNQ